MKLISLLAFVFVAATGHATTASIQELSWMSGHRVGNYQGLPMEATYSDTNGGMILGTTKISNGNKSEFFEFEQIAEENGTLVLRPYPFGKPGVEFTLKTIGSDYVEFENLKNPFPSRIIYGLRRPTGELVARIEGTRDGKPAADEFIFTKQ